MQIRVVKEGLNNRDNRGLRLSFSGSRADTETRRNSRRGIFGGGGIRGREG